MAASIRGNTVCFSSNQMDETIIPLNFSLLNIYAKSPYGSDFSPWHI